MILEISQLLWLQTPKGQAVAKFLIDRGDDSDLQWVCIQHETGEIWVWSNWDVRAVQNITLGRKVKKLSKTAKGAPSHAARGVKGGLARAAALSGDERAAIALKAANARWGRE